MGAARSAELTDREGAEAGRYDWAQTVSQNPKKHLPRLLAIGHCCDAATGPLCIAGNYWSMMGLLAAIGLENLGPIMSSDRSSQEP